MFDDVADLLRALTARYPRAVMGGPTTDPPFFRTWEVSCSEPGTAKFTVQVAEDAVEVFAGEDTWVEFSMVTNGRFPEFISREEGLAAVRIILTSIVQGGFEETVWRIGRKIVASDGLFRDPCGDVVAVQHHRRPTSLFKPIARRSRVAYAQYR